MVTGHVLKLVGPGAGRGSDVRELLTVTDRLTDGGESGGGGGGRGPLCPSLAKQV